MDDPKTYLSRWKNNSILVSKYESLNSEDSKITQDILDHDGNREGSEIRSEKKEMMLFFTFTTATYSILSIHWMIMMYFPAAP